MSKKEIDVVKDFVVVHGILSASLGTFDMDIPSGYWGEIGRLEALEATIAHAAKRLQSAIDDLKRHTDQTEVAEEAT